MGKVEAICTGVKKGGKKTPQPMARLVADHGIENDAHAGSGHRQVSLLTAEDIATMPLAVKPGDFAENLIVSGVDLAGLGLGSRLRLGGEAELTVTQLGKPESLVTRVADRPGHDRRYAITTAKLEQATGWHAEVPFEQGLARTIQWYRENPDWIGRVKSGAYQTYYQQNYGAR